MKNWQKFHSSQHTSIYIMATVVSPDRINLVLARAQSPARGRHQSPGGNRGRRNSRGRSNSRGRGRGRSLSPSGRELSPGRPAKVQGLFVLQNNVKSVHELHPSMVPLASALHDAVRLMVKAKEESLLPNVSALFRAEYNKLLKEGQISAWDLVKDHVAYRHYVNEGYAADKLKAAASRAERVAAAAAALKL